MLSEGKEHSEREAQANSIYQDILGLLQQGATEKADNLLSQASCRHPSNADLISLCGIRAYQRGNLEDASEFLEKARELAPNSAQILGNLGLVYNSLNKYTEALHLLDSSISIDSNIPEVHNNRGNALRGLSRDSEALEAYAVAISLRPAYAEALNNQGVIFLEDGDATKAVNAFEQAIAINPNFAISFNNLGNAFIKLENITAAFQCFEQAIAINPNYLDAYLNFGSALKKNKNYDGSIDCYLHALKINSKSITALRALADIYHETGNAELTQTYILKVLELDPNNFEGQLTSALSQIPKIYRNQSEVLESRKCFIKRLSGIEILEIAKTSAMDVEKFLGLHPFYLAYQIENNKNLLSQFGKVSLMLAQHLQEKINSGYQIRPQGGRIRLGIISHFFHSHPVWHAITKGWISQLNSNLFEIFLFNTNGAEDEETVLAKSKATYINCGDSISNAAQIINDKHLDILLYPEIGMDTTSRAIACLRLANLQIASWGHPETTGLTTIDYFLSADLFETNTSYNFYSEKLIALPNLGTFLHKPKLSLQGLKLNLEALGINNAVPILICAGSPSKYSPAYDEVLVEIAKQVGKCQFIFFDFDENITQALKDRIANIFNASNLNADDFIHFIPFLEKEEFHSLMSQSHLYLDTEGFSGFNTALQALGCNLPVVTIEGDFMRGKLASAILKKINLKNLICKSNVEYITKSVELIQNPDTHKRYKNIISENIGHVFEDAEPINALESFLLKIMKINGANSSPPMPPIAFND